MGSVPRIYSDQFFILCAFLALYHYVCLQLHVGTPRRVIKGIGGKLLLLYGKRTVKSHFGTETVPSLTNRLSLSVVWSTINLA